MNVIDFRKNLEPYKVFSLQDIMKIDPEFSYRQLDRWEKKGYLKMIKRGVYEFVGDNNGSLDTFFVANRLYSPSYISLEGALKFYNLIPEEVFQTTSVTTKKTAEFDTYLGSFKYRHVKPDLFWGHNFINLGKRRVLIASPEKALLDYLYLNSHLVNKEDFLGMRIDTDTFREVISVEKFNLYLELFECDALSKRASTFLNTIPNC